eukprot:Rmarinus@m.311
MVLVQQSREKTLANKPSDEAAVSNFVNEIMGMLKGYIAANSDRAEPVLRLRSPDELRKTFTFTIPKSPVSLDHLLNVCRDCMKYSLRTGHAQFLNQLFAGADPVALMGEFVSTTLNTSMYTYEAAPVFTLMEGTVLAKMRSLAGWPADKGDGIFSPGGSFSNIYAVNVARYVLNPAVKELGNWAFSKPLVLFTSDHSHYSFMKAAGLLGIGTANVVKVPCDESGRMRVDQLRALVLQARESGKQPFFVNATAGTTVYGAFDDIASISAVAKEFGLWLHVDGAWGASVLCSSRHRKLMQGVEHADSLTWNPHKMLGIPLQCSAFLLRDGASREAASNGNAGGAQGARSGPGRVGLLADCHKACAQYLFQNDKLYAGYDTGDKSLQCGRKVDVLKYWLAWQAAGDEGMERRVDHAFAMSAYLVQCLKKEPAKYRLVSDPQCTNVCFWYIPEALQSELGAGTAWLGDKTLCDRVHKVAPLIKAELQRRGSVMVGYQPVGSLPNFFRYIVMSSSVTNADVDTFLSEIDDIGRTLSV